MLKYLGANVMTSGALSSRSGKIHTERWRPKKKKKKQKERKAAQNVAKYEELENLFQKHLVFNVIYL